MSFSARIVPSLVFWRLLTRLAAVGITGLFLFAMARIESFMLEVLPPSWRASYLEHDAIVGLSWCVLVVLFVIMMARISDRVFESFSKSQNTGSPR